jgi:squalene cyclase
MKKKIETDELVWMNNQQNIDVIIDEIIEDSYMTTLITKELELLMRRLEQLSGKRAIIALDHETNKLYITNE